MPSASPSGNQHLLGQALEGDGASLDRLLPVYGNYLKLLARTRLDDRVQARVSASDVVQETLFEAHRDFHQFSGRTEPEFLGWLRRILANNLARSVERHVLTEKRDVRREVAIDEIRASFERSNTGLALVLADQTASPSSHAQRQEQLVELADALAALPEDYRDVLVLRHLEGQSFRDVAARLDRSEGAVRMLWLRAIDRLRKALSERGVL